jgi:hypothetical protein
MTVQNSVQYDVTLLAEDDLYLFNEGNHGDSLPRPAMVSRLSLAASGCGFPYA